MSINHLIYRSLKKNIRNYYLYVFALIFSIALYFAFVTLQYDPSMDEAKGSIKGAAAIRAGSVLLIAIVAVFLFYANNIFIKRRSKEIGLFQLIGMKKGKIFQIIATENAILYFGSLVIGIILGFSVSKLTIMVLFRITGVEAIAALRFSPEALIQTSIVFAVIYLFVMIMNVIFIKKQSILSLFKAVSTTEIKVKRMSVFEMIIGVLGIGLIALGYFVSTKLFSGDITGMMGLFIAMIGILGSVIIGTYLFYKGSVSFIFHLIRKKKDGYLNLNNVLSLSSLMFRMKSNAILLTIITTVSALAIGLLSLSYITYYSAQKTAEQAVPNHFSMISTEDADAFTNALTDNQIPYSENRIDVIKMEADVSQILEENKENTGNTQFDPTNMELTVVSDGDVRDMDVASEDILFTGYNQAIQQMMSFKEDGQMVLNGNNETTQKNYVGLDDVSILPSYFTFGLPVAVVDDSTYQRLKQDIDPSIQTESTEYIGIDMDKQRDMEEADEIFQRFDFEYGNSSRLATSNSQKMNTGLIMFIVGFLGLAFLITSGCILYFKQMDESENERSSYTILRKLGFTRGDLLRGIQFKQLFNFGIPLIIGLSHSYFAVKSGWFLFGTELWTPMILVMLVYTALYSIFAVLSVLYYKKVIKEVL